MKAPMNAAHDIDLYVALRRVSADWKKPLVVGALIGSLSLGLAACAPSTAATSPATEATEDEAPKPGADCADGADVSGDAILNKKEHTDRGEYCSIVVNPDSPALVYDKTKTNPALYELGYTDGQLTQIQVDAVTFAVNALVDHPQVAESSDAVLAWVSEETTQYMEPAIVEDYKANPTDAYVQGYDVTFSSEKLLPPLVYDGGARESQVTVSVSEIRPRTPAEGVTLDDASLLENPEVVLVLTTSYRVAPETYKDWRKNMLVGFDRGDSQNVVDEETSDLSKPLFYDHTKTINISYDQNDVKSEATDMKANSVKSVVDTAVFFNEESHNK